MIIQYYKHLYQCEKVTLGACDFYKGKRLFKNGRIGKRNKYFIPHQEGMIYTIISA